MHRTMEKKKERKKKKKEKKKKGRKEKRKKEGGGGGGGERKCNQRHKLNCQSGDDMYKLYRELHVTNIRTEDFGHICSYTKDLRHDYELDCLGTLRTHQEWHN